MLTGDIPMTRNTLPILNQSHNNNTLRGKQSQSGLPSFTFWISALMGMISLMFVGRQHSWGTESFNVAALTDQSSAYRILFPGLTPLVVSSVLAYQTHSPTMSLLSCWPLWLTSDVTAEALPAMIDFNKTLTTSQGLILKGKSAMDSTGYSVANAGDVNGDGLNDFLIGSSQTSTSNTLDTGVVYLIYGSTYLPDVLNLGSLLPLQGCVLRGARYDKVGSSLAPAGDINGDGLSDFLIGAPYARNTSSSQGYTGAVYLVYGSANFPATLSLDKLTTTQAVVLRGAATDNAGVSVTTAGDVNGDGKSDFLIGAVAPNSLSSNGMAYLLYGGINLSESLNLGNITAAQGVILQGGPGDHAGISVATAGDVNGDGKNDFLIGADQASPGGRSRAGVAYLIYGTDNFPATLNLFSLTSTQGVLLHGAAQSDNTGSSVATAGDVNGDGKSDFLVTTTTGKIYLIYGAANLPPILYLDRLTAIQGIILQGTTRSADIFVAPAGDINSDGKSDFFIGDFGASPNKRTTAGAAYLIYGAANLPITINLGNMTAMQGVVMQGGAANDRAGISVAAVGDVNGDGGMDILIGAYGVKSYTGAAYLVYGPPSNQTSVTTPVSTLLNSSIPTLNNLTTDNATTSLSAMPAEKSVTPDSSTPAVVGGVLASIVVVGAALAAYGLWRKKHKSLSVNTDKENPQKNAYTTDQKNTHHSENVSHQSYNEVDTTPYSTTQLNHQSSAATLKYATIDENKAPKIEYDHPPDTMGDDLKIAY